jgi:hypothetical protein
MRPPGALVALTLALAAFTAAPAPALAGPVTIDLQAAGAARDPASVGMLGRFTMAGGVADSGPARLTSHFASPYIGGTATAMGARGILTIGLGGRLGEVVDGRQVATGRWRVLGGTGAYRHLHGRGRWTAVLDLRPMAAGVPWPAMHVALTGELARPRTRWWRRPRTLPSSYV